MGTSNSSSLAGIGGGGIVGSVWIITAEIVPIENRPKWSMALSLTWSCSAIAGPLLGGVFSGADGASLFSWRWAFYLNLPVCFVALVFLLPSLRNVRLNKPSDASWLELARRFDFLGLILFMCGSGCLVVGFSFASNNGWISPLTLSLISTGLVVLVCGGFYETFTSRQCLFPPSTLKDRTTGVILLVTFLHNFAFTSGTYYLALYQQAAKASTPFVSGIKVLPYTLGSSLASIPAAWFIEYWQNRTGNTSAQNIVIRSGLVLSTLGFGLLTLLDADSSISIQVVCSLIPGIGVGMLFHAPYQVFTRALKPEELATGTSAFFLVRFTGATVGLAIAGAIFSSRASHRLPPNVMLNKSGSSINYSILNIIEPLDLRLRVLHVISTSIQAVWIVCAPCLGLAFLCSLFLRSMSARES